MIRFLAGPPEYPPVATAGIIERQGENFMGKDSISRGHRVSRRVPPTQHCALRDDDIRIRMKDLDEGRMRMPDVSTEAFRRALVLPSAEATRIPDDASPKNGRPSIPSGATKPRGTYCRSGVELGGGRSETSRAARAAPNGPRARRISGTCARGRRCPCRRRPHATRAFQ